MNHPHVARDGTATAEQRAEMRIVESALALEISADGRAGKDDLPARIEPRTEQNASADRPARYAQGTEIEAFQSRIKKVLDFRVGVAFEGTFAAFEVSADLHASHQDRPCGAKVIAKNHGTSDAHVVEDERRGRGIVEARLASDEIILDLRSGETHSA